MLHDMPRRPRHAAPVLAVSTQDDMGTAPLVMRSISAAFSQDGRAPFSQRLTVGCVTLTSFANACCVLPVVAR